MLTCSPGVAAAHHFTAYYTDSITAESDQTFIYNTFRISSGVASGFRAAVDTVPVHITIIYPRTWGLLSPKETDAQISSIDTFLLPVTMIKRSNSAADWQPFFVCLRSRDIRDTFIYYARATAFSGFRVATTAPAIDSNDPQAIIIGVHLKNTGNVPGKYYISLGNEDLRISVNKVIRLKPGTDTLYNFRNKVPAAAWKAFNNGELRLSVADSSFIKKTKFASDGIHGVQAISNASADVSNPYVELINFVHEASTVSDHASAFPLLKIRAETGYLSYNGTSAYFGAVSGQLPLGKYSKFSFDYHSRQYGIYNILDRDIYNLFFDTRHWRIHAGQVADGKYFRTYGTGLSVTYHWGGKTLNDNVFSVFGVRHTPGFYADNDNGGLNLRLRLGKVLWSQAAFVNTDSNMRQNSLIYTTEVALARSSTMEASVNGGFGLTQNKTASNQPALRQGGYAGYKFSDRLGNWTINATGAWYDKNFPGFNNGARNLSNSVRYRIKKSVVEAYYQYDVRLNNFYTDTIYNTDLLSYNVERYGLRYSTGSSNSGITIGGGIIQQKGQQTYSFAPNYTFAELQYNYHARRNFSMNISGTAGYAPINNAPGILATASTNISYRFAGISGGYSYMPVLQNENGEQYIQQNTETVYGGPYISVHLLRWISLNTQYSFSKTLYDNGVNTYANVNLIYDNLRKGVRLSINGSAPLQRPDQSSLNPLKYGFLNVSLRKELNLPFIFRRKYFAVQARFFNDENNNGMMDNNEHPIASLPVLMNGRHFITDKDGYLRYKNIDQGTYDLDLTNSPVKGSIPGDGLIQSVEVKHNQKLEIPYKKSKMISGRLFIIQDTTSENIFLPGNIKVTAADIAHREYSAITNRDGEYFLSVPAGEYIVSLNAESFNDFYRPVSFSKAVVLTAAENAVADFEVKQRKRGMKMIQVAGEITTKASKEAKKNIGVVPLTQKEIDDIRLLQAQSNHHELSSVDSSSRKAIDKALLIHKVTEQKQDGKPVHQEPSSAISAQPVSKKQTSYKAAKAITTTPDAQQKATLTTTDIKGKINPR